MYPDNKFEAKLWFFDAIQSIIGMILVIILCAYTLRVLYDGVTTASSFSAFWDSSSWYALLWYGISIILIFYGPYYLVTYTKNALSKWAYFRIDWEGIFTKEDGFMSFDNIKTIQVIDKISLKTWERRADRLDVTHYDDTTTRCDIEDVDIESQDILDAYTHFHAQWLKNQK